MSFSMSVFDLYFLILKKAAVNANTTTQRATLLKKFLMLTWSDKFIVCKSILEKYYSLASFPIAIDFLQVKFSFHESFKREYRSAQYLLHHYFISVTSISSTYTGVAPLFQKYAFTISSGLVCGGIFTLLQMGNHLSGGPDFATLTVSYRKEPFLFSKEITKIQSVSSSS